jgi:hypothetical protein
MLGQIRRHQKWLWFVIAGLTIISFVVFIDPSTGRRGGGGGRGFFSRAGGGEFGYINGRAIGAEEHEQMKREAYLHFLLYSGRWPDEDETTRQMFDADRQTLERIFLVEKVNELKIQVSDEGVTDWIAGAFRDRTSGGFQIETYQNFFQQRLRPHGYTEQDFVGFVRHQAAIEHLYAVGGLSGGLVTPREAETLYRQENEQISAEIVFFAASNYLAGVQETPEALAQYYTNNMAAYRIPERVQVSYVKFDNTNFLAEADQFLAQVTNLNQQLDKLYQQRGAEFYKDAEGKALPKEAAIQKIKEEEREKSARTAAHKKAHEFMEQLYDQYQKQTKQPDLFEKLAAEKGHPSAVTEPFAGGELPPGLKVFDTFSKAALALTPEEPMATEAILGEDAVYVIALKKKIPSEVQPLDAVRDKVTAEFRQREATDAARKAGQAFYSTLTNGLAQGKPFEAVCIEANVISHKLPPFSMSSRSLPKEWEERVSLGVLEDLVSGLSPGQTSRYQLTRDGGLIVHLLSREPVEETKLKAELAAFTATLREERRRQAGNEWLHREFELAHFTGAPSQKKSGSK